MSDLFNLAELSEKMKGNAVEYLEFLGLPSLNCGVYHLDAGAEDPQSPHETDEVYYVLSGKALFEGAHGSNEVNQGSIIFVPAMESHKFTHIEENLQILVFFSGVPAEADQSLTV